MYRRQDFYTALMDLIFETSKWYQIPPLRSLSCDTIPPLTLFTFKKIVNYFDGLNGYTLPRKRRRLKKALYKAFKINNNNYQSKSWTAGLRRHLRSFVPFQLFQCENNFFSGLAIIIGNICRCCSSTFAVNREIKLQTIL